MKAPPAGWPRISSSIFYDDAAGAITWLCDAFGFELRLKVEGDGGAIVHSELEYGGGLVMVGTATSRVDGRGAYTDDQRSPRSLGGAVTQAMCLHVEDVDAHHARAQAAGARIFRPLSTSDYGEEYWADRSYGALDPEGHQGWFMQRMRG